MSKRLSHRFLLSQIRKVTGEELEVALANREKPMIVDFYADWCGPCVLLAKELEQVKCPYSYETWSQACAAYNVSGHRTDLASSSDVHCAGVQVAQELGDTVHILKVDTEIEKALASQLRIQGLPTMIFIGMDPEKPALRTEGLLPANSIKDIVQNELMSPTAPAESGAQ